METVQPIRDQRQIDAMKRVLASNPRDLMLFVLGINSGLRISDLLALRVKEVTEGKGKVKERVVLRGQKTGKEKMFLVTKGTAKVIKDCLAGTEYAPDEYLFKSREGANKPITRQQAWIVLNNAAELVGITDKIGTHTLRKTFGYHAYQRGYDIVRLQQTFNHSAPSITLRYIGITQDDIDEIYLNMDL